MRGLGLHGETAAPAAIAAGAWSLSRRQEMPVDSRAVGDTGSMRETVSGGPEMCSGPREAAANCSLGDVERIGDFLVRERGQHAQQQD